MKTLLLTDDVLRAAARAVDDAAQPLLPKPGECTHGFSPEFQVFAEKLLRTAERKETARRVLLRVAAACLAAVLCLSAWLAVDVQAREAVFSWAKENLVDRVVYFFQGKEPSTALPEYRPTWLPEGYELVYEETGRHTCGLVYEDTAKELNGFAFSYSYAFEGVVKAIGLGDIPHEITELTINGCPATLYKSMDETETSGLMWIDTENQIEFSMTFYFDETLAIKIAEGITQADN